MTETPEKNINVLKALCSKHFGSVTFDVDMSGKNSIRVGGTGFAWCLPAAVEALPPILRFLMDNDIRWKVIGNGSNVLFPEGRCDIFFISLKSEVFRRIRIESNLVFAGAGAALSKVISRTTTGGLSGFEGLVGIPGTIGGAIKMNASFENSISDILERILLLYPDGSLKWINKCDMDFKYRSASIPDHCVIIEAVFRLKEDDPEKMKEYLRHRFLAKEMVQPLGEKTLGCTFKNPEKSSLSSGQLIDNAGLKGVSSGDAVISDKHANFIVNAGKATAYDVKKLIEMSKSRVKDLFGICLKEEIEIL